MAPNGSTNIEQCREDDKQLKYIDEESELVAVSREFRMEWVRKYKILTHLGTFIQNEFHKCSHTQKNAIENTSKSMKPPGYWDKHLHSVYQTWKVFEHKYLV